MTSLLRYPEEEEGGQREDKDDGMKDEREEEHTGQGKEASS